MSWPHAEKRCSELRPAPCGDSWRQNAVRNAQNRHEHWTGLDTDYDEVSYWILTVNYEHFTELWNGKELRNALKSCILIIRLQFGLGLSSKIQDWIWIAENDSPRFSGVKGFAVLDQANKDDAYMFSRLNLQTTTWR